MAEWIKQSRKYNPNLEGFGSPTKWKASFYKKFNYKDWRHGEYENIEIDDIFSKAKTKSDLVTLFKTLVKKYHPDINGNTKENNYATAYVISKYNILKYKFI